MVALTIECLIGSIAVAVYLYRNPQRYLVITLSVFLFLIFLSKGLMGFYELAIWLWIAASAGLFLSYFVRYRLKAAPKFIDSMKWTGVAFLLIYPAAVLQFPDGALFAPYIFGYLTIPILGTIYLYDRWILNPQNMKNKYLIIMIAQTVLLIVMVVFSVIQKAEADSLRDVAVQQQLRAQERQMQAELLAQEAERARRELQLRLENIDCK